MSTEHSSTSTERTEHDVAAADVANMRPTILISRRTQRVRAELHPRAKQTLVASAALLLALLLPAATAAAQAPALKWGPAPAVFPAGAQIAVLAGNPFASGEYTVRLSLPNNYTVMPHYHPTDENVTVISGTFLVGMGDSVEKGKMMSLPTGAFISAPAHAHHYAIARGRTVVQVHGLGPFQLTYVNPADDPTKKAAGKK